MAEFLTQKQVHKALTTAKATRPTLLLDLLWQTSCSISQATQLQSQDIANGKVRIGGRVVSVTEELTDALRTETGYVFASRQGGAISVRRAQQLLKQVIEVSAQEIRTASIKEKSATHTTDQLQDITGLGTQRLGQILPPKQLSQQQRPVPTTRDELLVELVAQTAATIEEVRLLRPEHIKTNAVELAGRRVPISKELCIALKRIATTYVFQGRFGPLSMPGAHLAWKRTTKKTVQEIRATRIVHWHATHTKEQIATYTNLSVERVGQIISEWRDAI